METRNKKPKEKVYECEVKILHQKDGVRFWKWIRRNASQVDRKDTLRCYECKGKVRLHRRKIQHGPKDHVEHKSHLDSEGCSLGHYYQGKSKISNSPVE